MALFACKVGGSEGAEVSSIAFTKSASAPFGKETHLTTTVQLPEGKTACGVSITKPTGETASFGGYWSTNITQSGRDVTIDIIYYNVASAQRTITAKVDGLLYYV